MAFEWYFEYLAMFQYQWPEYGSHLCRLCDDARNTCIESNKPLLMAKNLKSSNFVVASESNEAYGFWSLNMVMSICFNIEGRTRNQSFEKPKHIFW